MFALARPVLLLAFALVAACGHARINYDYASEPDPRKLEYVIGVSDGLVITVWKNPDLTTDAIVRPDGTVTMPLIGDIKAAGRTPSELKIEVTRRLGEYIKDAAAVVTVAVSGVNSYRFTVSGNVESPGVFNSVSYVTVAEAIALAGGLNKYARSHEILLVRTDTKTGVTRRIPIDWVDIRSNRRPEANLVLMTGDTIYVP